MAYPITLIIVIIAVVIFLMVTIIPNFTAMFSQFDAELPAITKFMLGVSNVVQKLWWLVILIVLAIGFLFAFMMRQNKAFHYGVHVAMLKAPLLGNYCKNQLLPECHERSHRYFPVPSQSCKR